jgi:DNA-binding NarL/FixJ family response regulator
MQEAPLVLALISDLFFSPRLASTAQSLGLRFSLIETAKGMDGPAALIAHLQSERPDLIVADLNAALPWAEWLAAAKADPDLAAIPWLAFGSHKDVETMGRATKLGADRVVAKSRFTAEMPQLIAGLVGK